MSKVYRLNFAWADGEMNRKGRWVADMMTGSQTSAARLKVSPEAIVAQAAQETGWGAHVVGQHNLFGIKADESWQGPKVLVRTREVINGQPVMIDDWFRDYPSFADSIADQLAFLQANHNYVDAGVFAGMGDVLYFQALQAAGYATDPHYAVNLIAVRDTVRSYFLPRIVIEGDVVSTPAAPPPATSPPAPASIVGKHRWLMIGMAGTDVLQVQKKLGFAGPDHLDGRFGKDTRAAVIDFQRARPYVGEADGIVGDKTWAAFDAIAA